MPVVIFSPCLPSSPKGYAGQVILNKNEHFSKPAKNDFPLGNRLSIKDQIFFYNGPFPDNCLGIFFVFDDNLSFDGNIAFKPHISFDGE